MLGLEISKTITSPGCSYSWNFVVEFDIDISTELCDNELLWLAKLGYDEMVIAYQSLKPHRYPKIKMPNAATLIAIGHRVYLATSVRGGANHIVMNGNYKVRAALAQCGADYGNYAHHRTSGNCGEQACAQLYFEVNPNESLTGAKV